MLQYAPHLKLRRVNVHTPAIHINTGLLSIKQQASVSLGCTHEAHGCTLLTKPALALDDSLAQSQFENRECKKPVAGHGGYVHLFMSSQ